MTHKNLIEAITNNNLTQIAQYLQNSTVQNELLKKNNMLEALKLAAKKGYLQALQLLMGCEMAKKLLLDPEQCHQVLFQAVAYNQLEIVKYLLQIESFQKIIALDDNVLLIRAASSGHIRIVDFLLTFKAVQDAIAAKDHAALREAVRKDKQAVIYRLVLIYQRLKIALPDLIVSVPNALQPNKKIKLDLNSYVARYKSELEIQYTRAVQLFMNAFLSTAEPHISPLPLRELVANYAVSEPPEYLDSKMGFGAKS